MAIRALLGWCGGPVKVPPRCAVIPGSALGMRLFSPLNCGLLFSDLFRTHTVNQSWGTLKWRTDISLTAALMSTGPGQFQHICASATARPAANHHRLFVDRGRAPDLTPLSPRRGGGSPSGHQSHRDQCSVFLLCSGRLVNPITAQRPPPTQSGASSDRAGSEHRTTGDKLEKGRGG